MRAFIFSLDAFVAFTLALIAIYSLIFFSSVPSSYYYVLTQAHYLTRDVLLSTSTTICSIDDYGRNCPVYGTVMDNMVSGRNPYSDDLIQETIGEMIPNQFGYALEVSADQGDSWSMLYDTADNPSDPHAKESKKLTVSSQVISFGYSDDVKKLLTSPYRYTTCNGTGQVGPSGETFVDWGLITCGIVQINGENVSRGNVHPSDLPGFGETVPSLDAKLVRFTVYI